MEGPRNYFTKARNNPQSLYAMTTPPPSLKPLKMYTRYNPTLRKYTGRHSVYSVKAKLNY